MHSSYLLASLVSDEKSAVNLTEDILYMMNHFSLAVFKILSLAFAFDSLIMMCLTMMCLIMMCLGCGSDTVEIFECCT